MTAMDRKDYLKTTCGTLLTFALACGAWSGARECHGHSIRVLLDYRTRARAEYVVDGLLSHTPTNPLAIKKGSFRSPLLLGDHLTFTTTLPLALPCAT